MGVKRLLVLAFIGALGVGIAVALLVANHADELVDDYDYLTTRVACQDKGGVVTLQVGGTWRNSCAPRDAQVRVSDGRIDFSLQYASPTAICLQVLTSWSETVSTPPLPDGTYRVYNTQGALAPELEDTVRVACSGTTSKPRRDPSSGHRAGPRAGR